MPGLRKIGATGFFRDLPAFVYLTDWATRDWLPLNPTTPLRILSAGCSSGEEPYSIAMALLDRWLPERFEIYAFDTHPESIQFARAGVYGRDPD